MAKKKATAEAQQKMIVIVIVALLLGWVFGYLIGATTADEDSASSTSETSDSLDSHKHDLYEVSAEEAPTIVVAADQDALGGWNVTLVTDNFTFTPEDVNEADELGTGHAHIWVDGEKIGRVYSNNYHLGSLGEGDHEITVTLNTNMHKDYAVDGEPVRASIEVTEVANSGDGHSKYGSEKDSHDDDDEHMHSDGESHSHSN